jgi:hypothetical protein
MTARAAPSKDPDQIIIDRVPKPRYGLSEVVEGFDPIYVKKKKDGDGGLVTKYRCRRLITTLTGEIRRCRWVGRKDACINHSNHDFSLPAAKDPLMRNFPQQQLNREKVNERIMNLASNFVVSSFMSCRQFASNAMHRFMTDLIQLGACLMRENPAMVVDVSTIIDRITDHSIAEWLTKKGDELFTQAARRLRRIRFVNLVADAGTVHKLKSIPCLLSNPHCADPPVLLELFENTNFTKQQYQELFITLFAETSSLGLVLCSVIVDNLAAQSFGLDAALGNLPVFHIKCFAHMTNLVLSNAKEDPNFKKVFGILEEIQRQLRTPEMVQLLGKKCPKFVRTRWFYMMDTLAFIHEHFAEIMEWRSEGVPTEILDLYALLKPYSVFIHLMEARDSCLISVVPFGRRLLSQLLDVCSRIKTSPVRSIFRDMHIRLLARLMLNDRDESITAYLLTLSGRNEMRRKENGYTTHLNPAEIVPDISVYSDPEYEGFYDNLRELMATTVPAIGEDECALSVFDRDHLPERLPRSEEETEDRVHGKSYKDWLFHFAGMKDEDRLRFHPYSVDDMYEVGMKSIRNLACRMEVDASVMTGLFQLWLFGTDEEIPFLGDCFLHDSPNEMWRVAHRYKQWSVFADLALRFVSCGTSEADAERILSMQRNIAGLHGTRFGTQSMKSRIRGLTGVGGLAEEQVASDSSDDDSDSAVE